MQRIKTVWGDLERQKRIGLIAAASAIAFSLVLLFGMAARPSMTLLYAGLESGSAGDVVRALEQRGAVYEVRGGSIYVSAQQRDELRMTLASEGLPANGGQGYELLDSLNGFGTTSQMFDAAYWRAKEGELARTIVASPRVEQARVHIANRNNGPFQRTVDPTASVSIVPTGGAVAPAQANAIRFLVASAVAGLSVENVAVIDANGSVIGTTETGAAASTADERAQMLRDRVLNLVEARVGKGNAVVEVSVDTVTETESIRERRFDPDGRVAISTDTEERSNRSTDQGGEVTVASNLPDGDAAKADGTSAQTSESRERVNYEVSETEHEILRAPGAIKRLTVAVLVNGLPGPEQETADREFLPRPEEELNALRDLVASAVGFDSARGDEITLKSMDLPQVSPAGTSASTAWFSWGLVDASALLPVIVLAVVSLLLGLFVVRPILTRPISVAGPPTMDNRLQNQRSLELPGPVLSGVIEDDAMDSDLSAGPAKLNAVGNPVDRLRALIGERQEETVEILRSWLEEKEENA